MLGFFDMYSEYLNYDKRRAALKRYGYDSVEELQGEIGSMSAAQIKTVVMKRAEDYLQELLAPLSTVSQRTMMRGKSKEELN